VFTVGRVVVQVVDLVSVFAPVLFKWAQLQGRSSDEGTADALGLNLQGAEVVGSMWHPDALDLGSATELLDEMEYLLCLSRLGCACGYTVGSFSVVV